MITITDKAVNLKLAGSSDADVLEFILNSTKSNNCAASHITKYKQALLSKHNIRTDIQDTTMYKLVIRAAKHDQHERLREKKPPVIPETLSRAIILPSLHEFINGGDISNQTLVYCMIAMSARPGELYRLYITDEGRIAGMLKGRSSTRSHAIYSVLDKEDVVKLVTRLKEFINTEWDTTHDCNHYRLLAWCKRVYGINLRDLRIYGAYLAGEGIDNRVDRLIGMKEALRHISLETSCLHYFVQ